MCSPQAQGHKWLTKGPKNLIAACIKEGMGGRESLGQREWGSLGGGLSCLLSCLWQEPSFWPLSQVSNSALITCERWKETAVMRSSPDSAHRSCLYPTAHLSP